MTKRRPPSARERAVLFHLLSGDDPLAVALRGQVDDVLVVEGGPIQPCCASRHIWAEPGAGEQLTGGHFHIVEAGWLVSPEVLVRLSITVSGHPTHLEITHDHDRELGPMEFPPPDELQEPVWWELDPSPAPPWDWTRRRRAAPAG